MEKVKFFGVAFDPDEFEGAFQRQKYIRSLRLGNRDIGFSDPYDGLVHYLSDIFTLTQIRKIGKVPVESWLRPKPDPEDWILVNTENYSVFNDANGCREYAKKVSNFVKKKIDKDVPAMIGVDHSLTGGVLEALSLKYGMENLSLIVIDAHLDAVPVDIRHDIFWYLKETTPHLFYPESYNVHQGVYNHLALKRPNTYNNGSFLYHSLKERIILPENAYFLGVLDYPTKQRTINDPGVRKFVDLYDDFEKRGIKFIRGEQIQRKGKKAVNPILEALNTPFVYVSFDVDVGALSSVYGTRNLVMKGIDETRIYEIAKCLNKKILGTGKRLKGFDVMEIDVHKAGRTLKDGRIDRTYQVAANFIRTLLGLQRLK